MKRQGILGLAVAVGALSLLAASAAVERASGADSTPKAGPPSGATTGSPASASASRSALLKRLSAITEAPGAASAGFGQDLACVGSEGLSDQDTPMSLDVALAKCLVTAQYDRAVLISLLLDAYSEFDSLRVSDITAHGVNSEVLPTFLMLVPQHNVDKFLTIKKEAAGDSARLKTICGDMRKIGPPAYYPRYMIAHGMAMFNGFDTPHGLVPGFDASRAWETALSDAAHCPGSSGAATPVSSPGEVQAAVQSDSLTPTKTLGCVAPTDLGPNDAPPDLYPAVVTCAKSGQFGRAVFMMMMAGVYSDFDTRRVSDPTTYNVNIVLVHRMKPLLSATDFKTLGTLFARTVKTPAKLAKVCTQMEKIGPPEYYPRYMVDFGMQAVTGFKTPNGLVTNFDGKKAWRESLTEYLRCASVTVGSS